MIAVKWIFLIIPVFSSVAVSAETTPILNSEQRPAWQTQDAKQVLAKMVKAMQTLNYQGTVAFLRDGKLEPMRYSHAYDKGHEQEHLLSLNSPLREVVRETGKVSCLYKDTRRLVVDNRPFERSFLMDMPIDINQLDAVYDIEIQGEENIAMLPAYVIAIKPKDQLRYARKVWVGQQWFLPLKVIVYDLADSALEELMFVDFEVKDTLPFIDMQASAENILPPQNGNADLPEQAAFVMSALPKGFKEVFFSRKPMRNSEQPVDHLLLSDGLASVSVYMEHKNITLPSFNTNPNAVQRIDTVNYYSHPLGDFQLTVMGEVPSETIRLIAENVKLRDTQH